MTTIERILLQRADEQVEDPNVFRRPEPCIHREDGRFVGSALPGKLESRRSLRKSTAPKRRCIGCDLTLVVGRVYCPACKLKLASGVPVDVDVILRREDFGGVRRKRVT